MQTIKTDDYSISLETISYISKSGKAEEYPLLKVNIWSIPGISSVKGMMDNIDKVTKDLEEKYISLTDFTNLKVNEILRKLIILGMEGVYKHLIKVKNPSILSFIILPQNNEDNLLEESLVSINKDKSNETSYKYEYVFIKDQSEIQQKVQDILG